MDGAVLTCKMGIQLVRQFAGMEESLVLKHVTMGLLIILLLTQFKDAYHHVKGLTQNGHVLEEILLQGQIVFQNVKMVLKSEEKYVIQEILLVVLLIVLDLIQDILVMGLHQIYVRKFAGMGELFHPSNVMTALLIILLPSKFIPANLTAQLL